MAEASVNVRPMSLRDLRLVLEWAAQEGWNPGVNDAVAFQVADPRGFLVAMEPGERDPSAAISVVRYGENYAFLGLYIARPDRRGQGIGWATWRAGMDRVKGRCVGLDGVTAQQDNYRRSGFHAAYRHIRFQGASPDVPSSAAAALTDLAEIPFEMLAAYDRRCFGAPRDGFLAAWVANPQAHGLAVIRDGELIGYGVARAAQTGWRIGPLFADVPAEAEALFLGLSAKIGDGPVILDAPEINVEAVGLATRFGLVPVFEAARMYTGAAPAVDLRRIFGVTSLELG